MRHTPRFAAAGAGVIIAAAIPVILVAATPASARESPVFAEVQDGVGSAHQGFRRHFWRGQFNHGPSAPDGYAVYDPASGLYLDADG